ncbi:MAG: hypothetical protein HY694_14250 [Deltaproteobacteria bacterium]|nr:hypothetical protein [Deltaproteobacteria bacterium]
MERRDGRAKRNVRTTAYHLDRRESPFQGDGRARSASGGLEGHVTEGHKKGGGSSRAEPRGLGGPWRQSALSPERVAPGYNWSPYLIVRGGPKSRS